MKPQRAKGLTDKWVVYLRSPQEQKENDYAYKIDYAYDAEGRLWRRTHHEVSKGYHRWTRVVPWHIADVYAWFPASHLQPPSGARRANNAARLPKDFDRYIVRGSRSEHPKGDLLL